MTVDNKTAPPHDIDGTPATASDANGQTASSSDVAAVSDGAQTLVFATFDSVDDAKSAYEQLKDIEDKRTLRVEGVLILARDSAGGMSVVRVTDHSTRDGLGWGALGGVIVGVLFPPSILGGALVGGAAGAIVGKLRNIHHKHEIADQLEDAIEPGQSGLVALVSDPRAVELQKALDKAARIVDSAVDEATANELKAAAKEIEHGER